MLNGFWFFFDEDLFEVLHNFDWVKVDVIDFLKFENYYEIEFKLLEVY